MKDALWPEAEYLDFFHRDIYNMCAAMVMRFATLISLAAVALASPIPDNADIIGCVNSWDSWGIACPNLGHHLFCDNLRGVRAGTWVNPPPNTANSILSFECIKD